MFAYVKTGENVLLRFHHRGQTFLLCHYSLLSVSLLLASISKRSAGTWIMLMNCEMR